jgi:DUF4097 and DUF4098 domain-containing protein YvlB
MTLTLRASAAVLLVGLAASPVVAQTLEERVDRTIPFEPGGSVRLKTFSGKVEIRGSSADQVVIHAVRRGKADRLQAVTFDIQTRGSEIVIDANKHDADRDNDNVVETDILIDVPARTRLDVTSFSAPVTVRGMESRAHVGTFSGDVVLEIAAWPDGQDLDVKTFSGEIDVRVPGDARGTFEFNTFSGDLESDVPITLTRSRGRREVEGTLNGGGSGRVRLKTFSGDARVRQ